MRRDKRQWLVSDFETATDDPSRTYVWAWAVCDPMADWHVEMGTSIRTWLEYVADHTAIYYFHNLAFDGSFILDYILKHEFTFVETSPKHDGEFTCLIDDLGKFYSIDIMLKGNLVTFYDSLKKIPLKVEEIATTFNLPEPKGKIDYSLHRDEGGVLDPVDADYIRRDVEIVARALHVQIEQQGMRKLTQSGDALASYKDTLGGDKHFRLLFPTLNPILDANIRQAYRGGVCLVEPKYKSRVVGPGISVDYNSMYPSQLISHAFPVGVPEYFEGRYSPDAAHPLYIQRLTCTFDLKPHGVPCVQLKASGLFGAHEYVRHCPEPVSISLTNVDLEIMMRQYDVDVLSWDGGFMFSAYEHLFDEYINYWKNIKETSKGGMRQLAKWMLNKLYGKFGSSPENVIKRPSLTEGGVLTFEAIQGAPRNLVYLPVAVWTTAYARKALFDAIDANRGRFIYCDTDSMHLLGTQDPAGIALHDSHFCAWKVEGDFLKARHLHAKAYMWYFHKSKSPTYNWQCVCAGATENIRRGMAWEDFYEGYRNYDVLPNGEKVIRPGMGKMRPERVPGGVILKDGFWSIKRLE